MLLSSIISQEIVILSDSDTIITLINRAATFPKPWAKPPGCEDTQEPVALLRSRLLEANIPEVLSAMEVKTRPISTQALFRGADLGCHVVGGWKSWNVWNERWCFFLGCALGFFLGNENYSLIETEGNKNLCVLTKLSTFKHPVFSSSAGGFFRSEKPAPGFTAFWRGWNAAG